MTALKSDDWKCDTKTPQLLGHNSVFVTQPESYAELLDFKDFSDITKIKV